MKHFNLTQWVIIGTILLWAAYDIYAYFKTGNPSTISATIVRWDWYYPWLPFAFGILTGHIFFDLREPIDWPTDYTKKD